MADPPGPPTTPRRNRARTNSLPPSPAPMQQPPLTHMDDLSDDDIDTIRGTPADDDGDLSEGNAEDDHDEDFDDTNPFEESHRFVADDISEDEVPDADVDMLSVLGFIRFIPERDFLQQDSETQESPAKAPLTWVASKLQQSHEMVSDFGKPPSEQTDMSNPSPRTVGLPMSPSIISMTGRANDNEPLENETPSKMQSESHAAHFYTPFVKPTRRYSATQTTTPMRRPSFPINVTRTDIKGVYDRNNSIDHYTQTIQKQPAPPSRSQKPRLGKSQPEKSAASAHPDKWNCSTVDRKPYQFPITKYQARLPAVAYQLPASEQRPQVAHQAPPKMQRLSAVANQAPPTENELRRPRGANQPPQTEQTLQAVTYQPPPTGETLRAVAYQPPPSEQLRPQPSRTARTHISDCGFDGADLSALPLTRRGSPEPMEARIWRLNTLDKIKKEQDKASRETAPEITPEPGKGKDPKRNSGYGYRKMAGQMDGGDDDEGRPPRSSRVVPTVVAVTKVVEKTAKSGRDGYMRGFFGPPSEAKAASKKADSRKNLQTRRSQKNKEQLKLTSNLEIPDSHASASEWSDISNSRPSKSVPAQAPKTPKKPAKLDKQEIRDSFGPSDSDIITISDGDSPPFRVGIPAPYQTKRTGVSSDKSLKNTNEILEDDGQARKASKASNSAFTRRASSRINQRRVLLTAQDPEDKETTLFKPISRPNQKQNRVRFVPEPTMREREDRRRKRRGESTTEAEQQNTTAATSMQSTPAPSVSGTGLLTSALTLREVKAAKAAQRKATKEMAANDAHEKDQAEKLAAFYETCQDPSHENYGLLTYDPSIDYGALDRLDPKSKNFIPALDEDDGKQGKYSPRTKAKILACHDVSEAELDLPAAAYVKRFANDEERKARLHYEKQKGKKPLDWSALNKAPFEFDKQKYEMEQRKAEALKEADLCRMKSTEEGYAKLQRLQQEKSRTEDIETARQEQCDKLAPILLQKAATSYDAGEAAREAVQAIQGLQYDSDKVMADIDEGANGNEHQYAGAHPFNRPGSIVRRPQSSALIGAKAATATPPNIFGSKKPASLALGDDLSGMKKDTITKTDSNGRGKRRRSFGMDGNAESAEYSDLIKDENKRQKLDADNQKPANCMGPTTPVKKRETVMDILHEDFKNPTPPIVPNARMMTGYGFNLGSPTPIDERRDIGDDILQHLGDNSWHFGNIRHGDRGWFGYAGPNEKTLAPHREETARMIARHDALMGDGGAVAGPAPIFDGGLGEMAGFAARASSPVKGADPFSRDVYMADADRTAESGVIDTSSKAENSATDSGVFLVGKESFLLESQPGRGASPQKDIEMEDGAKDVSDYGNAASDEVDATLVKGRQTSSEQLSDLEDVDMIEVNESAEADGADTAINTALPPSSPSSPGENGQLRNLLNAGTAGSSLVSDSAARNSGGNSDK